MDGVPDDSKLSELHPKIAAALLRERSATAAPRLTGTAAPRFADQALPISKPESQGLNPPPLVTRPSQPFPPASQPVETDPAFHRDQQPSLPIEEVYDDDNNDDSSSSPPMPATPPPGYAMAKKSEQLYQTRRYTVGPAAVYKKDPVEQQRPSPASAVPATFAVTQPPQFGATADPRRATVAISSATANAPEERRLPPGMAEADSNPYQKWPGRLSAVQNADHGSGLGLRQQVLAAAHFNATEAETQPEEQIEFAVQEFVSNKDLEKREKAEKKNIAKAESIAKAERKKSRPPVERRFTTLFGRRKGASVAARYVATAPKPSTASSSEKPHYTRVPIPEPVTMPLTEDSIVNESTFAFSVIFGTKRGRCKVPGCFCSCYIREAHQASKDENFAVLIGIAPQLVSTLMSHSSTAAREASARGRLQRRSTTATLQIVHPSQRPTPRGIRCETCRHFPTQHIQHGRVRTVEGDADVVQIHTRHNSLDGQDVLDPGTKAFVQRKDWCFPIQVEVDQDQPFKTSKSANLFLGKLPPPPGATSGPQRVIIKNFRFYDPVSASAALLQVNEDRDLGLKALLMAQKSGRNDDEIRAHIVKFFGVALEVPEVGYVSAIFEFAARGSLSDFLKDKDKYPSVRRPLAPVPNTAAGGVIYSWSAFFKLAVGCARGLQFLHSCGATHSRVNTTAFVMTEDMQVKLCGFGLAGLGENARRAQILGRSTLDDYFGNYEYVPPEVYLGGEASPPGDIYALSMVYWCLLKRLWTGEFQQPYSQYEDIVQDLDILVLAHGSDRRPVLDAATTPSSLQFLISSMWSTDLFERPDAFTVVQTLRSAEGEFNSQFREDNPALASTKWALALRE